jgi:hypothetical protein
MTVGQSPEGHVPRPSVYLGDLRETLGVHMENPQAVILRDVADPTMKRQDVALAYAWAIRQADEVDFTVINQAIVERWSVSGLAFIKKLAWRRVLGEL